MAHQRHIKMSNDTPEIGAFRKNPSAAYDVELRAAAVTSVEASCPVVFAASLASDAVHFRSALTERGCTPTPAADGGQGVKRLRAASVTYRTYEN